MNSNHQAKIRVKGKVQGVWFRAFTREKATELGVTGWVQNETDGAVYLEANGEKSKLDLFIDKLKQGPERSVVDDVEVEWAPAGDNWTHFDIRY